MSMSRVVATEAIDCLAHAWWIDSLLYLIVGVAVLKYALPLARGAIMCYKMVNSIMDMMALQSALATAKPVKPLPQQAGTGVCNEEPPRGVMRRPVVRPLGE